MSGELAPACSDHEVAIERRLHGDLPEEEARALDKHIDGCPSCRAYETTARELHAGLRDHASAVERSVPWDDVGRRIRARSRSTLDSLAFGLGVGSIAVGLTVWGFAPPGRAFGFGLAVGAMVFGIVALRIAALVYETRQVAQLASPGDLLAGYVALLRRRRRAIRLLWPVALAVVLVLVVLLVLAVRAGEIRHAVVNGVLAVIVAGSWAHALLVREPRLRRELAELGSDSDGR